MTAEGKLVSFLYNPTPQLTLPLFDWDVTKIQGNKAVTTKYQKRLASPEIYLQLSPDGKWLLWRIDEEESTWMKNVQQKLFGRTIAPRSIWRWQVTEIDGSHERLIGSVPYINDISLEMQLHWTPDSKGVHFLQDGKLMYLAVP